jgi:hypothetical protein
LTTVDWFPSLPSTGIDALEDDQMDQLQAAVRERYRSKAIQMASGQAGCCDGGACCEDTSSCGEGYTREELAAVGLTRSKALGAATRRSSRSYDPARRSSTSAAVPASMSCSRRGAFLPAGTPTASI